ncbi:MAG: C1 family peptidase [Candidatus Microsaccharimonas sp.]
MTHPITPTLLKSFADTLQTNAPSHTILQRAVTTNGINEASENNALSGLYTTIFSDEVETGGVTDQKSSGRCWLFATLNILRHQIAVDFKMDDLELSQSYSYFWDKLEKSNSFLEDVIANTNKPLDDRYNEYIFNDPQGDGGWWQYSAAIIAKYGIVPKSAMPEAKATSSSGQLNTLLNRKLRKGALELRTLITNKATDQAVRKVKEGLLQDIYQFLTIAIGTPPTSFSFAYKDKDKKFHRDVNITPLEFLKKYTHNNLDEYVAVMNDPSADKSYNQLYEFEGQGNVVEGIKTSFLNLDMQALRDLSLKQIKAGESIWFGCDVRTDTNKKGFMSLDVYDFEGTFGVDFSMDKAQRLATRDTSVNHAMTITGVDVIKDKPVQWKVENSWGDEVGTKGFYTMTNDWFNKNGYVIVIRKDLLTSEQRKALDKDPIVMPRWDPLNSSIL